MNDDYWFGPVLVLATMITFGMFLFGSNHGYNVGKVEKIKYCIEKPAECKLEYQYLKLKEQQDK
jgi:hypothetical protein